MNLRRFFAGLLVLCLCCSFASAEVFVEGKTVSVRNLTLNETAKTFVLQDSSTRLYQVVDAEMNPLSEAYKDISIRDGHYKVIDANDARGLLDGQGRVLIAPAYDDVQVISDRWAVGIILKEATAENYDYESWFSDTKKFYLIDTVDVFYLGEKKATLSRLEWNNGYAYGDYLIVQDREKKYTAYNKDFVKSPVTPEYSSEYNDDYNTRKIIHVASGQQAFVPECTLMPDEVRQYIWVNRNDELIDLQGNVLADLSDYQNMHSIDRDTNLIRIKNNKKKLGLMDSTGKILVPCEYEDFGYDYSLALQMGYLYAVKNGKGGFVSLKNGREAGFDFLESAGRQRSGFIVIEDPREGVILISAVAGELPGRYKEADIPYSSAAMFATVTEMDGRIHVIDIRGNEALPDNPEIRYASSVNYSKDGSVILVQDTERVYHIYNVTYTEDPEEEPEQPADVPAEGDGSWTCENGHEGNTGKFCGECGSPKPAEEGDGSWTCENGHEGNTGNFCTECGAAKPQ